MKSYGDVSSAEDSFSDFSFTSSSRHSVDKMFPSLFDDMDGPRSNGFSNTMADSLDLMSCPQSGGDLLFTQESSSNRASGGSRSSLTMVSTHELHPSIYHYKKTGISSKGH